MQKLAEGNTALVLDLLTARVMFERTGVQLYDAIIDKIETGTDARYRRMLDTLREHRNEEKEHEEWLEAQIRALGGDPHQKTTMARLEEEESQGVRSVILNGHTQVSHLIHALLTAELADNAGWDLLVKLADDKGDREAKREFMKRLAHEMDHLAFMREAVRRSAEIEVLGMHTQLPKGPLESMARDFLRRPFAIGALLTGIVGAAGAFAMRLVRRNRTRQAT